MNGIATVVQMLHAHKALAALIPVERIVAGLLPLNSALPAISVMEVSANERGVLNPGAKRHVATRVQATVMAADYPTLKQAVGLVRAAGDHKFPAIEGISEVSVQLAGTGPDFLDEQSGIYMQPQDFMVRFNEPR